MTDRMDRDELREAIVRGIAVDHRSQASVARALGISPSTVSRCLKELRLQDGNGEITGRRRGLPRGEIGAVGRSHSAMFAALGDEEYLDEIRWPQSVAVYDKMRRSDGQVQAMLLILELPIRATQWFVKPFSESPKDKEIAETIEENLTAGPPHGMTIHWDDFLRLALTMFPFGHSVFEKVFEVRGGYVRWRKFAQRPPRTLRDFLYDDEGGPAGIKQLKVTQNSYQVVEIPIEKLLVFSHRAESGDMRGQSVLRAAYKHWKIKDFVYKILNIGIERNLVGTPTIKLPAGHNNEDREQAKAIVQTLRSADRGGITYPEGFLLDLFEGKRGFMDVLPYIEHHDLLILRSILAQFLQLGGGDVGSFALSEDHSNLFLMCLNAAARYIANAVNSYAIPQLVDLNWDVEGYPRLAFRPIGQSGEKIVETLGKLVAGKLIIPDENIEAWLRELLELPERGEPLFVPGPQAFGERPGAAHAEKARRDRPGTPGAVSLAERAGACKFAEDGARKWRRDLTPYERRVQFREIEQAWDVEEEAFIETGREIARKQLRDLFERVRVALEAGKLDELAQIPIRYRGEFTKFLNDRQRALIDFGRVQAARELDLQPDEVKVPAESKALARARAGVVADQIAQRIKTVLILTVLDSLEAGTTLKAALFAGREEAEAAAERELVGAASVQVGDAINQGRQLAADEAGVHLAQYSAILDDYVCPLCEFLDGKIIEVDDPDFDRFTPRLHHRCRCLWVYIHPDETPQPQVTWETPDPGLVEQHGSLVAA